WFTLRDPRTFQSSSAVADAPTLSQMSSSLWTNATFRSLLLCFAVISFFGYGIAKWQPAFFVRSYDLKTGELGTWLAIIHGVAGFAGVYLGGELATRRAAQDERLQLAAMALLFAGLGLLSSLIYLVQSLYAALALMGIAAFGGSM